MLTPRRAQVPWLAACVIAYAPSSGYLGAPRSLTRVLKHSWQGAAGLWHHVHCVIAIIVRSLAKDFWKDFALPKKNSRPKARRSRALGIPLTSKCVKYFERRPYPPGEHGRKRRSNSDYQQQLLQKQRLRAQYDISEKQLRRVYEEANRREGKSGEILVVLLEQRLDAVVWRAGIGRTIYQARQFVTHNHILVNGKRVNKPSYRVRPGDVVEVSERSRSMTPFIVAAEGANAGEGAVPQYLDSNLGGLRVVVMREPNRSEIPIICEEQLVVEYYSR